MEGVGLREERVCAYCMSNPAALLPGDSPQRFIEDHAAGDIVCNKCGTVAEAHIIDERSEWRTFGDKDKEADDPSRVGSAANPLLGDSGLTTGIGRLAGGPQFSQLQRLHARQTIGDKALQQANREIGVTCDRLRLPDTVRNAALEVFKDTHDAKAMRGRTLRAVYAACIYVAAKRERVARTFKEICAVMPDVSRVDIGRCFTAVDRFYKIKAQHKALQRGEDLAGAVAGNAQPGQNAGAATQATDLIKRFTSRLGVDNRVGLFAHRVGLQAAALAAAQDVPWAARDPATQACGLMYGALVIHKLKHPEDAAAEVPTWEQLSAVGGMAPQTIREGFRQMVPFFKEPGKLVARNDAAPEVLARFEAAVAKALGGATAAAGAAGSSAAAAAAAAANGGGVPGSSSGGGGGAAAAATQQLAATAR